MGLLGATRVIGRSRTEVLWATRSIGVLDSFPYLPVLYRQVFQIFLGGRFPQFFCWSSRPIAFAVFGKRSGSIHAVLGPTLDSACGFHGVLWGVGAISQLLQALRTAGAGRRRRGLRSAASSGSFVSLPRMRFGACSSWGLPSTHRWLCFTPWPVCSAGFSTHG